MPGRVLSPRHSGRLAGTPRPSDYQPAAEGEHRQAEPGRGTDGGVTPVETGRVDTDDLCCRLGRGGRSGVRSQVGLCHPWSGSETPNATATMTVARCLRGFAV